MRERAYVEAARVTGASQVAHPVRAHRAQHPAALLRLRRDRHRLGDHHRGERQLPGLRRSRQHLVGHDAAGRLRLAGARRAASMRWFVPPGVCIILVVVAGFFISRGYEEVFMPRLQAMTVMLSSRGPADPLRHARRHRAGGRRRDVRRAGGQDRRPGRRIGLRQDHGGARHHGRAGRERQARRRPGASSRARRSTPGRTRPAAVARHRLRAAKRHELARSGLHRRRADRGGAAKRGGASRAAGRRRARPSCSSWSA